MIKMIDKDDPEAELIACPFCGGKGSIWRRSGDYYPFRTECDFGCAKTAWQPEARNAAMLWNLRIEHGQQFYKGRPRDEFDGVPGVCGPCGGPNGSA